MSARIANSSALGIRSFNLIKDSMLQSDELPLAEALLLSDWPIRRPRTWRAMVSRPQKKTRGDSKLRPKRFSVWLRSFYYLSVDKAEAKAHPPRARKTTKNEARLSCDPFYCSKSVKRIRKAH